jgi:hypothetical protein
MNRLITIIIALLASLSISAQVLWRVEGGGLKSPSYILGTHHLVSFAMLDSIPGIREAMRSTSQVVGEVALSDVQKPENMEMMQQMIVAPEDSTLRSMLTDQEYATVDKAVKLYLNTDLSAMPAIKPAFISNNIVVMMYIQLVGGFHPQEQMDAFFQSFAVNQGRKVVGLETPEFQFRLLYCSQSLRRQADELLCQVTNVQKTMTDARQLTALYMRKDLDAMLRLTEQTSGDACDVQSSELDTMLFKRNADWAEKLPSLMVDAPSLVVVGALHLPGPRGLIQLLKSKGYKVSAVK